MYVYSPPLYRGMKASYAWTQSGSYVTPILLPGVLPGVHPYHCFGALSLLVSVCIGSLSLVDTPAPSTFTHTPRRGPMQQQSISALGEGWQMDTGGKSSSLWPEVLEGKTDKRQGGGKDGRLQRTIEGVNEREEEEIEVNRVKWHPDKAQCILLIHNIKARESRHFLKRRYYYTSSAPFLLERCI